MKQNRKLLLILATLLSLVICLSFALTASADYQYKVRIYSGNQGVFANGNLVENVYKYEDRIYFDRSQIKLNNPEKYYVKGIRLSGTDYNEAEYGLSGHTGL